MHVGAPSLQRRQRIAATAADIENPPAAHTVHPPPEHCRASPPEEPHHGLRGPRPKARGRGARIVTSVVEGPQRVGGWNRRRRELAAPCALDDLVLAEVRPA